MDVKAKWYVRTDDQRSGRALFDVRVVDHKARLALADVQNMTPVAVAMVKALSGQSLGSVQHRIAGWNNLADRRARESAAKDASTKNRRLNQRRLESTQGPHLPNLELSE